MTTLEDGLKLITDNKDNITILLLLLFFLSIIYINLKINDLEYRFQQTLSYTYMRKNN